jgi:ABC-type nitrate/sulfonate/bicarbonate transport system substrate-binding protein
MPKSPSAAIPLRWPIRLVRKSGQLVRGIEQLLPLARLRARASPCLPAWHEPCPSLIEYEESEMPDPRAGPGTSAGLDTIWMMRCPVPAATGVAFALGFMYDAFAADGIAVRRIVEGGLNVVERDSARQQRHLFREGSNIRALSARSQGAPTRVIGLTWIDERQAIIVRPDSGVMQPSDLKGLRCALPAFAEARGESIARGMALRGIENALSLGGLSLGDVELVEIDAGPRVAPSLGGMQRFWRGLEWLAAGKIDAVYVKGAAAADAAERLGLVVGVDLDAYPSRLGRINNGTPRPIVVHQHMLDHHLDLVERFLEQTLRAADWAATHRADLTPILARETWSSIAGVETAYRNGFHRALHPALSADRVGMLQTQADFLWQSGFLDSPVDVAEWIDFRPLAAAATRTARPRRASA